VGCIDQASLNLASDRGPYHSNTLISSDPVTAADAFFVEIFGTAMLSFTVYALTNSNNDTQQNSVYIPPLIGFTVGALIGTLAPLTQCGCKSVLSLLIGSS
jgi:glycerol uptake facilitator-like aquaporin